MLTENQGFHVLYPYRRCETEMTLFLFRPEIVDKEARKAND